MYAKFVSLLFLFSSTALLCAQQDSVKYRHYNNKITIYSLTGYNATNVSLNPKYGDYERQRYMLNPPLLLGFGLVYKGIDVGITRRLPYHLMNTSKYGKSDYFDFKFKYSISRLHLAFRAQRYQGFALLNHQYGDSISPLPHFPLDNFSTFSLNIDARYFFKKDFSYKAALGFSGEYLEDYITPYIYGYTGGSNIKNAKDALLPAYAQDPIASISYSQRMGCFEFGAIPGVALVKRHKDIQGTILLGWGPLIQTKWHAGGTSARAFFGFSSRTDLQWSLGYHQTKWFVQLISEVQFRRMNFRQIRAQQYYYDLRIFFGYLIGVKNDPKIVKDMENKGWL